jgi:flagellar motor switch protein FliN/FliY
MANNKVGGLLPEDELSEETPPANLDLVLDIPLAMQVQLGETRMTLREVLKLGVGSLIRLNKSEAESVELYINGKLVATGQIVTTPEGTVGVQVHSIVTRMERIRSLK